MRRRRPLVMSFWTGLRSGLLTAGAALAVLAGTVVPLRADDAGSSVEPPLAAPADVLDEAATQDLPLASEVFAPAVQVPGAGSASAGMRAIETPLPMVRQRRVANGAVVPVPVIETLDCEGIEATLEALDRSNYRAIGALPEDHPDRPVFDYENRLAEESYNRCIAEGARLRDASEAFEYGFEE